MTPSKHAVKGNEIHFVDDFSEDFEARIHCYLQFCMTIDSRSKADHVLFLWVVLILYSSLLGYWMNDGRRVSVLWIVDRKNLFWLKLSRCCEYILLKFSVLVTIGSFRVHVASDIHFSLTPLGGFPIVSYRKCYSQ